MADSTKVESAFVFSSGFGMKVATVSFPAERTFVREGKGTHLEKACPIVTEWIHFP